MLYTIKNTRLVVLSVVFLLLLVTLLLWRPWHDSLEQEIISTITVANDTQQVLSNQTQINVSTLDYSEEIPASGMCEDYTFYQGQRLELDNHMLLVERISSSGLRLIVDGEHLLLTEGNMVYSSSNLRVELKENNIIYFSLDDPQNAVLLRVGCKLDEDPRDKYVREQGKSICERLYSSCKSSFNID